MKLPVKMLEALYWAEIHMREARDAAKHLILLGETGQELAHSIYTGIVVSYSRSFGSNQGLSAINADFSKFTDPKLQNLHGLLLEARRTIYAHKDVTKEGDRLPVELPRELLRRITFHVAESGVIHWIVQRPALPTTYLNDIISLCEFQAGRMNVASGAILQNFLKGKSYSAGDYTLGENFP